MPRGSRRLAVTALVLAALVACTPPAEETTAAPPPGTGPDTADARPVDFEPGATVMVLAGELGAGRAARYVVGAHEGDLLMAHALSPGDDMRVAVHRLDQEAPVADTVETESYWAGRLPATGGYLVEVHGAGEVSPYHLEIEVPRHLPLTAGASRIALEGTIQPHAPLAFVAGVEEGRTLDVSVASEGDVVKLTLHGAQDGQALADWDTQTNTYQGEVPRTQDYVVRLDPGAEATGFELSVTVE